MPYFFLLEKEAVEAILFILHDTFMAKNWDLLF